MPKILSSHQVNDFARNDNYLFRRVSAKHTERSFVLEDDFLNLLLCQVEWQIDEEFRLSVKRNRIFLVAFNQKLRIEFRESDLRDATFVAQTMPKFLGDVRRIRR